MKPCEFREIFTRLMIDSGIIYDDSNGIYMSGIQDGVALNAHIDKIARELFEWFQNQ